MPMVTQKFHVCDIKALLFVKIQAQKQRASIKSEIVVSVESQPFSLTGTLNKCLLPGSCHIASEVEVFLKDSDNGLCLIFVE